jgi:hypothetical protein
MHELISIISFDDLSFGNGGVCLEREPWVESALGVENFG